MPDKLSTYKTRIKKLSNLPDELKKPISVPKKPIRRSLVISDDEWEEKIKEYNQEHLNKVLPAQIRKFSILMEYYGASYEMPEKDWFGFSLQLAKDFVPGFEIRTQKESGRNNTWCVFKHALLYLQVQKKLLLNTDISTKKSIAHICSLLAKEKPWSDLQGITGKNLQNHYSTSKRSLLVKLMGSEGNIQLEEFIDEHIADLLDIITSRKKVSQQ